MNCGLGIRPELFEQVAEALPELGFLEAHSENYFGDGLARDRLLALRQHYPISLHGVGLSLGRADDLDTNHLAELRQLVDAVDPLFVSEHLSWSAYAHQHVPDLLPLPLTAQALTTMCDHIDRMQDVMGRQVLVENPSNYLAFDQLQVPEPEFLNELAHRTGCGLLVDVNNVYVSAFNLGREASEYLSALDASAISQYHLAGYTEVQREQRGTRETLLIDTHNHLVSEPVWGLYEKTLAMHGAKPTLFEWDSDFPELDVLITECEKANAMLRKVDVGIINRDIQQTVSHKVSPPSGASIEPSSASELAQFQTQFLSDLIGLSAETRSVTTENKPRFSVYQNNVFGALQDYLSDVFPATQGVVGEPFFRQMAQLMIQQKPPRVGNIHHYGGELLEVLVDVPGIEGLPYLADLIRYEWALHQTYFGEPSPAFEPTSVPEEDLLSTSLKPHDSIILIESEFPIAEIHRQSLPNHDGEVSIDLAQGGDCLLVHKTEAAVETLMPDVAVAQLLASVRDNGNLLQAIEALAGSIDPNELSAALSFLFTHKLLQAGLSGT